MVKISERDCELWFETRSLKGCYGNGKLNVIQFKFMQISPTPTNQSATAVERLWGLHIRVYNVDLVLFIVSEPSPP